MKKLALVFLLIASAAGVAFAVDPIPRTLTQAKLDKFIQDYETVIGDESVHNAWETSFQAVSMAELMDPNSALLSGDTLVGVFTIMLKTRVKAKADPAANAALRAHGWTDEFWDLYIILTVSIHYKSVIDGNAELAKTTEEDYDVTTLLPPVGNYIHPKDYELVLANYARIQKEIEDSIARDNNYF